MATFSSYNTNQNMSQRPIAMVLALISAVVLSPLYHIGRKNDTTWYHETKWGSGFVLPMILAGLIIAIKTVSSSPRGCSGSSFIPSSDPSWVLRIGSSSWGLAGVLLILILVISWQDSVQEFFWR